MGIFHDYAVVHRRVRDKSHVMMRFCVFQWPTFIPNPELPGEKNPWLFGLGFIGDENPTQFCRNYMFIEDDKLPRLYVYRGLYYPGYIGIIS